VKLKVGCTSSVWGKQNKKKIFSNLNGFFITPRELSLKGYVESTVY